MTKRETLIRGVLLAVARVEGWDGRHPSIKDWGVGGLVVPSPAIRRELKQILGDWNGMGTPND